MKTQYYQEAINEAILHVGSNPEYLLELAKKASADTDLTKEEIEAVLIATALKNQEFTGEGSSSGGSHRPESLFPRYSFLDDGQSELPCGLAATNRDKYEKYSHWLRDEFLPTFHPMPRGDLQYPVIACLMLLNAMAATKTAKFPHIWIQGLSGCGKSNLLDSFGYHYPDRLIVRISPDVTGASLRDEIDAKVSGINPVVCLWDNFWIRECLEKIGAQRSILIANNRQNAKSTLSTRGDNNQREFFTHCIKAFSTVDDGKDGSTLHGMIEITRRLWVITCRNTGEKPLSREGLNWQGMQDAYNDLWGHAAKAQLETEYAKCFKRVMSLKADKIPFDAKIWEILIVPLAVWLYVGLGTLEEGLEAFRMHREWTYQVDTAQTDVLLQVLREFMKIRQKAATEKSFIMPWHDTEEKQEAATRDGRAGLLTQVSPDEIKQYIERVLPMMGSINQRVVEEKIAPIMSTFGYLLKVIEGKAVFLKL